MPHCIYYFVIFWTECVGELEMEDDNGACVSIISSKRNHRYMYVSDAAVSCNHLKATSEGQKCTWQQHFMQYIIYIVVTVTALQIVIINRSGIGITASMSSRCQHLWTRVPRTKQNQWTIMCLIFRLILFWYLIIIEWSNAPDWLCPKSKFNLFGTHARAPFDLRHGHTATRTFSIQMYGHIQMFT